LERGHRNDRGPGQIHDLVVMRRAPSGELEPLGRTLQLQSGESEILKLDLEPGEYVLFCSVVEDIKGEVVSHQEEGMDTTFRVTAAAEADGEARSK